VVPRHPVDLLKKFRFCQRVAKVVPADVHFQRFKELFFIALLQIADFQSKFCTNFFMDLKTAVNTGL